jgi:hypothetical protein
LATNPNARRRFLREARAAAAISHPHVVTIHAVDEGLDSINSPAATIPFLVMECVVGQTLQQKLDKQGSLRLRETLRVGHQIAEGLVAAHKQGLIHRDIKPANILLENGVERVKITDFGLARTVDDVSITRTGEVSGTPQYMSPEQASGEPVDHRSDLFSFGCVLYALCTGRSPFRATTLAAAIRRVCDDAPRPIEEINAEVPAWLIDIVNRLLDKNPDNRPQSADEVAALLGQQLASVQQPAGARSPTRQRSHQTAALSIPSRRPDHPGLTTPVRLLLWLGAIVLLVPLFIAIGGTAMGAGGDALEASVVAGMICISAGVTILAIALLDNAGHPAAEPTSSAEKPSTFLALKSGPAIALAAMLFIVATLVMGQAFEQWSAVSAEVAAFLFVAAVFVGALALACLRGAGIKLTLLHWLAIGLASLPLMFLGAQVPSREFKRTLANEDDIVGIATAGVSLLAAMLIVAFGSNRRTLPQSGPRPPRRPERTAPTSPWRVLGWIIVLGVVLIPVSIAAMVIVPYLARSSPPVRSDTGSVLILYDVRHPISAIFARSSLRAGRETRFDVTGNPFGFPLPRGVNDLTIVYQIDGQTGTVERRVDVDPNQQTMIDMRHDIFIDATGMNLDKPVNEEVGEEAAEPIRSAVEEVQSNE